MPKKLADQSHHVLHLGAKTYILNSVIPLFDELKDNPEIVEDFLDTLAVWRLPWIVLTTMEK